MTQRPLAEMADFGYANMSEESGYILDLLKRQFAVPLIQKLEEYLTRDEFLTAIAKIDSYTSKDEFLKGMDSLLANVEARAKKSDLETLWKSCETAFASKPEMQKLLQSLIVKLDDKASSTLLAEQFNSVLKILADKANSSDMDALMKAIESKVSMAELSAQVNLLDKVIATKAYCSELANVAKCLEDKADKNETAHAMGALLSQMDILKIVKTTVTLTSAQILDLHDTPIILVTPFSDKSVEILKVRFFLDYATTAYADVAGKYLSVEYETSGQILQVAAEDFLDETSDQRRCGHPVTHSVGLGESVQLSITGSDVTTGDSPITVEVYYQQI